MTPSQIFPILDGLLGFSLGSSDVQAGTNTAQGSQTVETWVRGVKELLRSFRYRDLDDIQIEQIEDLDQDGGVLASAAATHYIAILIENIALAAEAAWVIVANAATDTFVGTSALDNDVVAAIRIPTITTTGVSEFWGSVAYASLEAGVPTSTDITVSADGQDGGDPETNALRAWLIFRT